MPSQDRRPPGARRGAFTLIELLVVIVVIGVLLTLVVAVGSRVTGGGKTSLTQDLIRTLDTSLDVYMGDNNGDIPPAAVMVREIDPSDPEVMTTMPIIDGVANTTEGEVLVNSIGLYLRAVETSGAAQGIAEGMDADHVRRYAPVAPGDATPESPLHPELTTVFDAWDQPLRFVHPKFAGEVLENDMPRPVGMAGGFADMKNGGYFFDTKVTGNIPIDWEEARRNFITTEDRAVDPDLIGDGDGGRPIGGRPYFYSMGPDADPSKRDDNVYSTEPQFLPDRE